MVGINMANIKKLHPERDVDTVLENAKGQFEFALVLGYDREGFMLAYGGGVNDGKDPLAKDWLFLLEQFKIKLVKGDYA